MALVQHFNDTACLAYYVHIEHHPPTLQMNFNCIAHISHNHATTGQIICIAQALPPYSLFHVIQEGKQLTLTHGTGLYQTEPKHLNAFDVFT